MFSFCNAMFPLKRKVSHKIHKATIKNVLVFKKQKDVGSQRSAWSVSLHSSARQVVKFPYHRSGQTLRTLNYWNLEPPGNLAPKCDVGPPHQKRLNKAHISFWCCPTNIDGIMAMLVVLEFYEWGSKMPHWSDLQPQLGGRNFAALLQSGFSRNLPGCRTHPGGTSWLPCWIGTLLHLRWHL